ncbi:winged helix-turn-helix transcriptional regulator [Sinorhizobium fredii]|uniref:winged helix-turn-helix transcriptional regulator n=1 Tax=Rhizobium fredii TaxID=380 RepID=UPI0035194519
MTTYVQERLASLKADASRVRQLKRASRMTRQQSLSVSNQARKDAAEFNHKAVHVLTERAWMTCAIAELLEISKRTVRLLRSQPCAALEVERQEAREREARAVSAYTGGALFLTVEDMPWLSCEEHYKALSTREKIRLHLEDGLTQVEIARLLGISQPTVSYHAKQLRMQHKRKAGETVKEAQPFIPGVTTAELVQLPSGGWINNRWL